MYTRRKNILNRFLDKIQMLLRDQSVGAERLDGLGRGAMVFGTTSKLPMMDWPRFSVRTRHKRQRPGKRSLRNGTKTLVTWRSDIGIFRVS